MSKSTQIVPFPLPPYLASYFANEISTDTIVELKNGVKTKPLSITRSSQFGKFIYRCLTKSNKKIFVEKGYTFFIEIHEKATDHDKFTKDARSSFVELKPEEIKEITEVFKAVFETALFNFVAGSCYSFKKHTSKQRGYLKDSISQFCKLHGLIYTDKNLMAWEQAINRANNKRKSLISKML